MYKQITEDLDPDDYPSGIEIVDITKPAPLRQREKPVAIPNRESFRSFTLADLSEKLRVGWLWEGWLPKGMVTLLVGEAGIGKSALALDIANTVMTGSAWPNSNRNDNPDGLAVWTELEGAQAILRERAIGWNVPLSKLLIPCASDDPLDKLWLDEYNEADWQALETAAHQDGVKLLVLDSLRGAYHGNENDSDSVCLMIKLAEVARDADIAVLIIHHLRKRSIFDGAKINLDRVRGSSAIVQIARCVWAIDRPSPINPETCRLQQIKNNLSRYPDPLGFNITDAGLVWVDAPDEPRIETTTDKACDLLLALLADGPMPATEIFEEGKGAGLSEDALRRAKKVLGIESIKQQGMWRWTMPTLKIGRQEG